MNGFKVIAGSSNKSLSDDIKEWLRYKTGNDNFDLVDCDLGNFSDGETKVQINENLRGYHIFVIQSLCNPVNDNLIELTLILDALKRSNTEEITVIIPYYGYGRQDKKSKGRSPISASTIAKIIELSNPNRVVTIDLHAPQIQGFFNCPVDNLYANIVFFDHINYKTDNLCIISPDSGGTENATLYSKRFNCDMGFCYKHREKANEIDDMRLVGDVSGKSCIIIDDICDTGSTLLRSSEILRHNGAERVEIFITHGVFSKGIRKLISSSSIDRINITDTILQNEEVLLSNKMNIVSVAPLLGDTIIRLKNGLSLSELFI